MATLPVSVDEIIAKWGPHKHYMTKESARARASQTADEFVKTHCCFCGLQCGIKLKVKDKKVVGFEPWVAFAQKGFNVICKTTTPTAYCNLSNA